MQETTDSGFLSFVGACISGAVVSAVKSHKGSYMESFIGAMVGFMVAYWCGPLVAELLDDGSTKHLSAFGFLLGLLGKEITSVCVDVVKTHGPAIIAGLLRK